MFAVLCGLAREQYELVKHVSNFHSLEEINWVHACREVCNNWNAVQQTELMFATQFVLDGSSGQKI